MQFPESSDPGRAALVASMKGKTLPQIGVVEISLIDEDATRLLEFERGGLDYIVVRGEPATRLLTNGKLKPEYAAKGVTRHSFSEPVLFSIYFNMEDRTIGGMDREHIALRRAIALGIDMETMVKVVYAGQAQAANQIVPQGVTGHDPAMSKKPLFDRAAAKRLLDRIGYDKFDAEGFRKGADGKPLTVTFTIRSGNISRETQVLLKRDMDAIGLRMEFHVTPFQDVVKELMAGKFQLAFVGQGGVPSGYAVLIPLWGKAPSSVNISRFKLAEYDAGLWGIPAGFGAARPDRRGAQDDGTWAGLHADAARDRSHRIKLCAAVGHGFQSAHFQALLEVPRHRSRETAAGNW